MKKIALLLTLSIFTSCKGQEQKEKSLKKEMKNYKIEKYDYKHDKKIFYGIGVSAFASVEIYVDDILLERKETSGNLSLGIELNDWLLENGTHTYKVRYLPQKGKNMVLPYLLKETDITIDRWEYVKNSVKRPLSNKENYTDVRIRIPVPPEPVPVWEIKGEFEVTGLPYKLEGWQNSQDLSKMDKDVLKKEVVAYYNYYRGLLNNGKIEESLLEEHKKNSEVAIATYDDPNWYLEEKNMKQILTFKNSMLPIENYTMEIFGKGKLVRLIKNKSPLKGKGVLIRETPTRWSSIGVVLHKPKGSDSFKIIRK